MADTWDLVVVGAGPGGYVAAIRAAQLGMRVAVVEQRRELGGTCLNVGCIPSKALLDSSELYYQARHKLAAHGIGVGEVSLDLARLMARKDEVVSQTVAGIEYLFKKNQITRFTGVGSLVDAQTVHVSGGGQETTLAARHIVLATGSESTPLPGIAVDGEHIITSTEALGLARVPEHLLVLGGGFIGLELGSVYARLGAKVTVVEFMDSLIPVMDRELGTALLKALKAQGLAFHLRTRATGASVSRGAVKLAIANRDQKAGELTGDVLLVAVGRRPYTTGLNLAAAGLKTDDRGRLPVNARLQTAVPHIYAIGDLIAGPMLAHKAEEEGVAAAEFIAGQSPQLNPLVIPGVVYTWPEVAGVGRTEEQLRETGVPYKTGKFPFKASGRARAAGETEGFVKVLAHAATDEILGVHMIGPRCSDLIAEAVVAMEFHAAAEDLARIIHAHPTFSEPLKEAALAATANRPLHL